ncbi:NADH dehydrogenase FAD-containing subunit [Streptomyces umbrinus]|uniref:NAD(P)/FAD-dependent oxidoreductase n=1 Tax=Streptomyces umbrinus TaxID=67370 RepID=UPI00167E7A0A|nr:FAD-dependent oxidoreductase [Streptomyces umbrinus]MCR3729705.1 NADH dehydrogenase FAD-containing subunit [Streptomyces umbrinus]GHH59526.1 NADH dehydrogenase [Streptomyces umbrinus]
MAQNTEVVVLGGGYAGVMAANRLTQRDDVSVTLINPRPVFVHRIRLHQVVGGSHDVVVDYREVLAKSVRLVVDTAAWIDTAEHGVALAAGGTVGYDYLIYAVGSGSADPRVPGAAEFAHPIASLEEAQRLWSVLDAAPATAAVTVVGAGALGIETAAELAEAGRTVTLVCGEVLGPYLHPRVRRSIAKRLAKLGVTVFEGPETKVTAVTRDTVRLGGDRELPSAVTVWTAGFGVPDLAARSGLSTDALGRLLTDETLTSVDDVRIVAAGDSAAPSDLPLRMSCQAAGPLGAHAADTVLSRIAGGQPASIDVGFFGLCVSLGRRAATVQLASKDDTANRFSIRGRVAVKIKESSYKGLLKHLADEARKPGSHTWPFKDAKRRRLLEAKRDKAPAIRTAHRLTDS